MRRVRMRRRVLAGLVTSDDRKVGSVMMELRAGTGGDEASLWARDLFEMYQKYAGKRGWNFEPCALRICHSSNDNPPRFHGQALPTTSL